MQTQVLEEDIDVGHMANEVTVAAAINTIRHALQAEKAAGRRRRGAHSCLMAPLPACGMSLESMYMWCSLNLLQSLLAFKAASGV